MPESHDELIAFTNSTQIARRCKHLVCWQYGPAKQPRPSKFRAPTRNPRFAQHERIYLRRFAQVNLIQAAIQITPPHQFVVRSQVRDAPLV